MQNYFLHTKNERLGVVKMPSTFLPTANNDSRVPIQENKIVYLWGLTTWFVVMNTTMFNVALPSILTDLSLSSSTAAWIVSGYSIAFAISTLTFSRLSDYLPISRLLLGGLTVLGLASLLGFFSTNFIVLLSSRILQAIGAGAVPGLGMIVAGRFIPLARRGKAMAIIASGASLGFGLGPVIGGIVTQYLGWNFLFAVTLLVVLLIPFFNVLMPKEEVKKGQFDLVGAVLTAVSVTGILLYLSTFSYSILFITIILSVVWWIYLNKKDVPFIQPDLFKHGQYLKLLLIGFLAFFLNFSNLFLMPIILSHVFNKEPVEVGMIIFPGAILAMLAGQVIGRLIDRYGTPPVTFFGQFFLIIAACLFAYLSTISSYYILTTYMFASIGFAALNTSISNEVTRILHRDKIGAGMGILQLIQFVGGAIGVTISGILITAQDGFPAAVMYRNIYLVIFALMIFASIVYVFYFKKLKMEVEKAVQ